MLEPESTSERRTGRDRRTYNRRTDSPVHPPYYEVFDRIAVALEQVAAQLAPGKGPSSARTRAPGPRRSDD